MFERTVNDLIIFYRGVWMCAEGLGVEMSYCMAGKVRGACVPGCMGVKLYVSVFNVLNLI